MPPSRLPAQAKQEKAEAKEPEEEPAEAPAEEPSEKPDVQKPATQAASPQKITVPEKPTTTAKPAAGSTVSSFEDFKKSAHVYDKEAAYSGYQENLQPIGVGLDEFTQFVNAADTDNNNSIKQDELGAQLYAAIQRGDMTEDEANAWFRVFWNGNRSKTYTKWAQKYKP